MVQLGVLPGRGFGSRLAILAVAGLALGAALGLGGYTIAAGGSRGNRPVVVDRIAPRPGEAVSSFIGLVSLEKWPVGNPTFSPDGSSFFAFTKEGLQIGQADGVVVRVLEPSAVEARWSADSNSLAVVISPGGLASDNQDTPIELITADGSSRRRVAVTDLPRKIQMLPGKLAYVGSSRLHLLDLASGVDSDTQVTIDMDPANDMPYQVSPDARFVALLTGTTLNLVDLTSQTAKQLTSAIDARRWAPYAWSRDGRLLAYTEVGASGRPQIVVYDVASGSTTAILESGGKGFYAGLNWTPDGGWLLYAFHPRGNRVEEDASYEAINVYTGERSVLFRDGLGLRLSQDGRRVVFTRTADPEDRGTWVATINF